jgi:endonuclease/exonuclease/phosphatase family metal-dependent hydrolase
MRKRVAAAVGTVTLLAASGLVGAPAPAAAEEPVRVMQYNFCGAICNDGVVNRPGWGNDVVEDIRQRIVATQPHLVMLHEACSSQIDRLRKLLADSDWPMDGVFRAQRQDRRCEGTDEGFGDAVFTAGEVGEPEVLDLPDLGSEDRAILCLNTDAHGPVLACTLHLVTGKGNAGEDEHTIQLASAAAMLNYNAGWRTVVVGGDFNAMPHEMGALLADEEGGHFFDIDPEAAGTRGQKIDYVLFSRKHFSDPFGDPTESEYSDHQVLQGWATRHPEGIYRPRGR